jgi:hypothetical protein
MAMAFRDLVAQARWLNAVAARVAKLKSGAWHEEVQ